jgi:cell division protein FtsB
MPTRPTRRRIPVVMPVLESPAGAWLRGLRNSGFTLTVLFLVIAALVVLAPSLKTLVEQRAEIADLRAQQAAAEAEVDDLQADVDRWSDPTFLRAQARDRLLYAYPGDVTYLVVNDDPTLAETNDGLPISAEIQAAEVDWVQAVLSSGMTAALTDEDAAQLVAPELDQ